MNETNENNGSLKDLLQNALYTEAFSGNCNLYKEWLGEWKKKYPKKEQELDLVKALAASFFLWKGIGGNEEEFKESLKSCEPKDQCLDDLKKEMRDRLEYYVELCQNNGTGKKGLAADRWVKIACDTWQHPPNTARFLLMCAFDQAVPDEKNSRCGFLRKENGNGSKGLSFLTEEVWNDMCSYTVEHVAPQTQKECSEWSKTIYMSIYGNPKHRIFVLGNLLFLPQSCNSSASNNSWEDKKEVYKKCAEDQRAPEQCRILCESVLQVKHWDADLIRKRSHNMAQMVWETLSPWLGYK